MTPYEIVDAQLSVADKVTTTFRWWVSISFAALVAAYIAGHDLAGLPSAIILVAYTLVSISALNAQRAFLLLAEGLDRESQGHQDKVDEQSPALDVRFLDDFRGRSGLGVQMALRGFVFLATVGYVLYRTIFMG